MLYFRCDNRLIDLPLPAYQKYLKSILCSSAPAISKAPTPYTAVISSVTFFGSAPIGCTHPSFPSLLIAESRAIHAFFKAGVNTSLLNKSLLIPYAKA